MGLVSSDGHAFDAYEVHNENATRSVVIIQEIFGVNDHIQRVVDRYAAAGFRAIAPALFDRVERGVELAYDDAGMTRGIELMSALPMEHAIADVGAAVAHVAETGPVAVVGYCYGGTLAWLAAHELPVAATVGYYGGGIAHMLDKEPKAPIMLHFGGLDQMIPEADRAAIAAAYPDVPIFVYDDADHGFNCSQRASHNEAAAALAEERTFAFIEAAIT